MAENVKFLSGIEANLPDIKVPGQVYFAITDANGTRGKIIFDKDNEHRYIMGGSPYTTVAYAICQTDGGTSNKYIAIQQNNDWVLAAGSSLFVKFANTNIAPNPQFSVYSSQDKLLKSNIDVYYDTDKIALTNVNMAGQRNRIIHYVYDGSVFWFVGWSAEDSEEYDVATHSNSGLIKPWLVHTVAANGPTAASDDKEITVNDITDEEGRYYAVEMDKEGRAFVNVPSKMSHTLTIGIYQYDGSEDVEVPVYGGKY